ncbi:MAG: PD40 domain-containing protein [Candidatus Hydrogenedentes bacterium]|nr:PD40 domain-containing protein [Candidatus Hydrogenedentota bacterium]
MRRRFHWFIYKLYTYKPTMRRFQLLTVMSLASLLSGCYSLLWAATIWGAMLLMIPVMVLAIPVVPIYYAVEGRPGNTGTQTVAFAPDGESLVVAYKDRKKMHLYQVPLDGSASTPLTEGDRFDFDLAFAPDGTSIVFASRVDKKQSNLFSLDLKTKSIAPLTSGAVEDWAPRFSPSGDAIVFTRRDSDTMAHICLLDIPTGEVHSLTSGEESYDVGPAFLPDGNTVLFARLDEEPEWGPDFDAEWDRRSLFTITRTGADLTKIAEAHKVQEHWAKRVAEERPVATSYAGNLLLCNPDAVDVLRAGGVGEVALGAWVEKLGAYTKCVFSPDGQRVAFATCKRNDEEEAVYTLRAAVTTAERTEAIAEMPCQIRDPVFSPDGARLVFRVFEEPYMERDHYALWTVRFDGTDLRRLPVSEYDRKQIEKERQNAGSATKDAA